MPLVTQYLDGLQHKVHGTQGMMKTGVQGPGIDQMGQPQLLDPPQTLKITVLKDIEEQISRKSDETMHRIVQDLALIEDVWAHFDITLQNMAIGRKFSREGNINQYYNI